MQCLEKFKILNNNQFGFRSSHTTTQAVMMITDKIKMAIERKIDTVDHGILLAKLKHYGIRGIAWNWFCSFLSQRKQFVKKGDEASHYQSITCGVPQSSVLGPLLFLIYDICLRIGVLCLTSCYHLAMIRKRTLPRVRRKPASQR